MKIKMSCKLCEMSAEKEKFVGFGCTHSPPYFLGQFSPIVQPLGLGLANGSFAHLPQIRDMMLAAYLLRGYYQPAGPLISVPHGHGQTAMQQPPLTKSVPLSDTSPSSVTSPVQPHQVAPPPAPSSNGDSSDNEVIITSVTAGTKDPSLSSTQPPATPYRYPQYSQYPYSYPPQYHYPTPPPPTPPYAHHEFCYPAAGSYVRHAKYAPTPSYHRYPYYPVSGAEIYPPPAGPAGQPSQQVVTASPISSNGAYPSTPTGPPPPPTIMETYPPPPAPPTLVESYQPPPHYYPSAYGLPPTCYSHSPSRAIPYINATYQTCPCPMQSCPKNVLTGPLTGESKRSNISKDSMPLPPVALALPLEPASATGPPSPARGSAGMPPPPSPAGATYQPPPPSAPKQESRSPETQDCKVEKKRKARVGKAMVRSNMQNTMLLMCNPSQGYVKREIESPKDKEELSKKEIGCGEEAAPKEIAEPFNAAEQRSCNEAKDARIDESRMDENSKLDETKTTTATTTIGNTEETMVESCTVEFSQEEPLPPCVATVAENVKVKNMKRKQSKEQVPDELAPPPPEKKKRLSSYKDFIRKHTSCFKINNGKRKLISKANSKSRLPKIKLKSPTKRKLIASKEQQTNNKRMKLIKTPLTECNDRKGILMGLVAKRDNIRNKKQQGLLNKSKSNVTKTAANILDNLIAKNNVDKVIEDVISESKRRTIGDAATAKDKCANNLRKCAAVKNDKHAKSECKKTSVNRRKSATKCRNEAAPAAVARVPRRSLPMPRWSNGWRWEGEPYEGKVFINSDETTVTRKCYPAMRHEEGDQIVPKDCVLLKAGTRKNELPFVAKIAALWESPDDGEMMMSLLWYYRPEHTEQGRLPTDQPDEVFASRHKDSNSVACIDDKCYVLTFSEYCRYRKTFKRLEEGIEEYLPCIPIPEPYPRSSRQPPINNISPDMVFFCCKVYDFRQKRIIKNPT